ncbi:light-independent protochlorophyllide reductaseiron-sulfur ATP-binding protein [Striga asiatica]|uniref:Light-independent protochlorophyllide reductaseiron-sulfur ATP-binding protein n=1 Tax=Striga asiatica TaxID=4170 RepID=A0A5A7P3K9_STRAF|nr:light-independent protochlorophyllide reductaseiron-sulfur ATP-binding protein [Striga asiatica]
MSRPVGRVDSVATLPPSSVRRSFLQPPSTLHSLKTAATTSHQLYIHGRHHQRQPRPPPQPPATPTGNQQSSAANRLPSSCRVVRRIQPLATALSLPTDTSRRRNITRRPQPCPVPPPTTAGHLAIAANSLPVLV